ncbi:hypothetical protein KC19_5G026100 [Ceratodon purpureus]|uniref:Protein kinase domain-containing protein n=1 Tax=Ceratodon purpureus TaxID=3225 RepID=A0A8T0HY71_CERPU|nr:hypothetical protein KC19_5G026100 [Ceratodon purpureus]
MYTYSVLPLDVMALGLQVEDRSSYELQNLELNRTVGQQDNVFEVIGNGGFGSIYKGSVLRHIEHIDMSASANKLHGEKRLGGDMSIGTAVEFKGVKRLGRFHGVLLEKSKDSSLSQVNDCAAPVEEIMVAVKKIALSGEVTREDLDREARTMRVFWGCRNFAAVYGLTYCKQLKSVCIVMEVVSGCNLNQFLRSRGTAVFKEPDERTASICDLWSSNDILWWIQKLILFREIVLALMLCHGKKVYHGDLKGYNILLDKQLIPKLIDFGLSFQRRDVEYLRHRAWSLFWAAPEVIGNEALHSDVLADPFPSDVYSLGMLLFEVLLDGETPDSFTDENIIFCDKLEDGGYPVSLDVVQSKDSYLSENVLRPLKALVDECCKAKREERIVLQDCLSTVEKVHSDLFSKYSHTSHRTPCERDEDLFIESKEFKEMMPTFHDRFPDVRDYLVFKPSLNMVISEDGTLLVHCFCSLDFVAGVQYIVEKSAWDFQAERDIPHMSLLCVENECLSTLKYIAASWSDVLRRQFLLIHKACNSSNLVMFKLLLDIGIDFDTWVAEEPFMKPIHQLAAKGKTEFLRCLLDHPGLDANYINTASPRYGRCYDGDNTERINSFSSYVDGLKEKDLQLMPLLPEKSLDVPRHVPLYYAVVEDRVDTVKFILQRGGMYVEKSITEVPRFADGRGYWFSSLLHLAQENFSIGVVLELQYTPEECASSPSLGILRQHVDDVALSSPNRKPIHVACQKGQEKVFKAAFETVDYNESFYVLRALMFYIARGGSKEMIDIILDNKTFVDQYFVSETFSIEDVAFLLLAEGTSTSLVNSPHGGDTKSRISVLDVAVASGNTEVVEHILKLQPEDSESEDTGDIDADRTFGDLEVNREALELSANLEGEVMRKHNPYDLALDCCRKGHVAVLKNYEDCGKLDLDAIRDNKDRDSILHHAVDHAHMDMVKYLLERGFPVDSTNWYFGETPLQHACSRRPDGSNLERQQKMDIASLLLEKGADPNYVNQEGYTAMDQALDFNDKQMVRFLVDHGFDLGRKNRYGEDYMTRIANI